MSESFKEEFMNTDIGFIPGDWKVKQLQELAKVTGGKRLPKGKSLSQYDTGHPYIRVSDMEERGISLQSLMYVPLDVVDAIKRYRVEMGDLYISVAGTLGLVGEVPKELDGANLTENADRISEIQCDRKYLLWVLRSKLIQKTIKKEQTSNAQPKLALTRIKDFLIPIPPRSEQRKIASILSYVDEAIEKIEAIIGQTEQVKKGLMQQLFTKGIGHTKFKKTEIGEIPVNWEVKSLDAVLKKIVGGGTPSRKIAEFYTGHIPWVTVKDMSRIELDDALEHITEEAIKGSATNLVPAGTVIVATRIGLGRAFINKVDVTINQDLKALIIDESLIYNKYLLWWYLSRAEAIEAMGSGTTVKGIRLEQLKELKLPLPTREEQIKIVKIIDLWQQKVKAEQQKLLHLQTIKEGLMQSLLTGKVRVKVDETEVTQV